MKNYYIKKNYLLHRQILADISSNQKTVEMRQFYSVEQVILLSQMK